MPIASDSLETKLRNRTSVAVLAHDPGSDTGPHAGRYPGPARIADATKPRLVLKHEPERAPRHCLSSGFGAHHAPELFLNAFCVLALASGWYGRGTSLRQPCRARSRYRVPLATGCSTCFS